MLLWRKSPLLYFYIQFIKIFFLNTINSIFSSSIIPVKWKSHTNSKMEILPILKPGKGLSYPSSYFPIALIYFVKFMEHLVKNRLEWFLERKNISPSQFGFRKSFVTIDSLSTFSTEIHLNFSINQFLIDVFLDISSAYDYIPILLLRQK